MNFEMVAPGKYRAKLDGETFIWVRQEGPSSWWWFVGKHDGHHDVWHDGNGPFDSCELAIDDAIANYKEFEGATIVWWVHRPTYGGGVVESPRLWRLHPVIAGSERDRTLASGRTQNSAGDYVEIPGQWVRFDSRAEAEAWLSTETERWYAWWDWWNS